MFFIFIAMNSHPLHNPAQISNSPGVENPIAPIYDENSVPTEPIQMPEEVNEREETIQKIAQELNELKGEVVLGGKFPFQREKILTYEDIAKIKDIMDKAQKSINYFKEEIQKIEEKTQNEDSRPVKRLLKKQKGHLEDSLRNEERLLEATLNTEIDKMMEYRYEEAERIYERSQEISYSPEELEILIECLSIKDKLVNDLEKLVGNDGRFNLERFERKLTSSLYEEKITPEKLENLQDVERAFNIIAQEGPNEKNLKALYREIENNPLAIEKYIFMATVLGLVIIGPGGAVLPMISARHYAAKKAERYDSAYLLDRINDYHPEMTAQEAQKILQFIKQIQLISDEETANILGEYILILFEESHQRGKVNIDKIFTETEKLKYEKDYRDQILSLSQEKSPLKITEN